MFLGEVVEADVMDEERPGDSGREGCGFLAFLMPPTGVTSLGKTPRWDVSVCVMCGVHGEN
jgi:hypothetical protein